MAHVLIIGAKSDIARAIAHKYAKEGFDLFLAARNSSELDDDAKDYENRYSIKTQCLEFDLLDFQNHEMFFKELNPQPEGVIAVAGYLGEHKKAEENFNEIQTIVDTNYTGWLSILSIVANEFEKKSKGFIVGISSVAGDRGRKSNYFYGSAKAGFSAYLSGLRGRLASTGVKVLTVKPGFVNTKMTEGLKFPELLLAEPETVAKDVFYAQKRGRNVIYTKSIWFWVMLIIKHIPEFIFKRLNL